MNRNAVIVSTGRYVPEIEVSNDELRERFKEKAPEFVDKMEKSSGIESRYYAPDDWATSDLAARASLQAIERAGLSPADIDMILLGTDSPDYITPATSVVLQEKIGAKNAGTFDIVCACASFPTGLATAQGLIATNPAINNVLVVGVYMMHRLADPNDPMIFFYGDGAGAAVLQPAEQPGILGSSFLADGSYSKHWGIFAGGTAEPASVEAIEAGRTNVRMVEKYPPEVNERGWPTLMRRLSEQAGFTMDDIDLAIFTQVRKRTILKVAEGLSIPTDKAHTIMEKWGYTGSACIGMALDDAIEKKRIEPGSLVTLVGSGVGYNQAAVAVRFTDALRH
jgi:3-oxoacyl-[acyl-carrier-protein] synthase-3